MTVLDGQPRFSRRSITLGAFGALALGGSFGASKAFGQTAKPVIDGDCSKEPGVETLINWQQVVLTELGDKVNPPLGWQLFTSQNTSLVLLVPPDWQAQFGWATQFTNKGAPILETTPDPNAALRVTRLLNKDSTIAYESGNAILQGVALTSPIQAAPIAIQGLLGEDPDITPICSIESFDSIGASWMTAHRYKQSILVTSGVMLSDNSTSFPFTSITYQTFYGPRESFDDVVRDYFIRFLYQQLQSGGSEPTPTPTPEF